MKKIFGICTLLFSVCCSFAGLQTNVPNSVHLISANRVIDAKNKNELLAWKVSVDLDKDVSDNISRESFSFESKNTVLRLDGIPYDPKGMLPGFDPALEILMWYSLNYPIEATQNTDGSVDFKSIRGDQREAYMKLVKSRHVIGPWVEPESSKYNNPSIDFCRKNIWKPISN